MKKFLIGIILWCSVAIQAAEQGPEKDEKKKERRQRAQSAGPLPVPVPVSPSGGLSPAAASPGSVQPNIGASASPTSPVLLGVVQQAIELEGNEIERLRERNKPFRLFNRKKSPVVSPGRPASVGAIPQRSASAGTENSYSESDVVQEFLKLFEFKKALFRKEVIERSPTDQELDHLAEKLSVDLYQRYLKSLESNPLDPKRFIENLNRKLFASDAFKDAKKEKQDILAKTFRKLTDKVEQKLQKFRVMSPHQLQLAKNRERALSESPPGGGQFSPPPMMSSLPAFIIDDGDSDDDSDDDSDSAFAPIEKESDQHTHGSPADFFRPGRSVTPRPDTTILTGRGYKEHESSSGLAARRLVVLPVFPEEEPYDSFEWEPDYQVAGNDVLPADNDGLPADNDDDDQGEEDEPNLADFMAQEQNPKVRDKETEI